MLLHLQLLVLDDALISVSLAEAQHSGYVGPISKPTRGGKGGGGAPVGRGSSREGEGCDWEKQSINWLH